MSCAARVSDRGTFTFRLRAGYLTSDQLALKDLIAAACIFEGFTRLTFAV